MNQRIVLAYSGSVRATDAIAWLRRTHAADVVTVTLDIGQTPALDLVRQQALAAGALRAHAIDARDAFARECLLPSLAEGPLSADRYPAIDTLALPLIARKLVEIARIEGAASVAHVSTNPAMDAELASLAPSLTVLNPAAPSSDGPLLERNLWGSMAARRLDEVVAARRATVGTTSSEAHAGARVDIGFEDGVPVAINDVPMSLTELIESVALIAEHHGVGRLERSQMLADGTTYQVVYEAPAAVVLHAAHAACPGSDGVVQLTLVDGACTVLGFTARPAPQVDYV